MTMPADRPCLPVPGRRPDEETMDEFDCVVVGAGVVGLAVARALALAGREVLVLDAAEGIGTETSSRNSEVIHAGIYYPAGSLMARACVEGKHRLYDYCRERGIPHANCGKLIVATDEAEAEKLGSIQARAAANGVPDLARLTREEALALEPELHCTAALLSPSTGIIDSHAFMLSLQGDAANAGAVFVFHAPVLGGRATAEGVVIEVGGRGLRLPPPVPGGRGDGGGRRHRGRRRRADGVALPHPGERRRPACAEAGAGAAGNAEPTGAHLLLRQGQLLHPDRAQPLL